MKDNLYIFGAVVLFSLCCSGCACSDNEIIEYQIIDICILNNSDPRGLPEFSILYVDQHGKVCHVDTSDKNDMSITDIRVSCDDTYRLTNNHDYLRVGDDYVLYVPSSIIRGWYSG